MNFYNNKNNHKDYKEKFLRNDSYELIIKSNFVLFVNQHDFVFMKILLVSLWLKIILEDPKLEVY